MKSRFTIQSLFLVMLVAAFAVAWWGTRNELLESRTKLQLLQSVHDSLYTKHNGEHGELRKSIFGLEQLVLRADATLELLDVALDEHRRKPTGQITVVEYAKKLSRILTTEENSEMLENQIQILKSGVQTCEQVLNGLELDQNSTAEGFFIAEPN